MDVGRRVSRGEPGTTVIREVADLAAGSGLRVGVAESLTAGRVASALGSGPDASSWFSGGVVAYRPEVKFQVLGVTPGPVNCASCAVQMADGALRLLEADVAVAATGVGGPGPDEGVPAGTVFVAVARRGQSAAVEELHLAGSPGEVLDGTVDACLRSLVRALTTGVRPAVRSQ
ncbi:CinA family protein [Marmoricola sp. RAF53]|uniref:CinA family protein n=1 Tax=Marmoricola sp. RAF53 TaxID=3233059 RepID=UPI003F9CDA4C